MVNLFQAQTRLFIETNLQSGHLSRLAELDAVLTHTVAYGHTRNA